MKRMLVTILMVLMMPINSVYEPGFTLKIEVFCFSS